MERVSVDVPDDYLGVVTQLLALRKGTMTEMVNHGTGWVRLDYRVPARGLIGFRTEFLTETRGTGILHHIFDGWEPWHGELKTRRNGSMVADRRGQTTTFALMNLQERGTMIVGPAEDVYEGMVIGENARQEEMDVNPTKEKKLNNIRSANAEEFERLTPALNFSLEHALEFIAEDECVEVTPKVGAPAQGGARPGHAWTDRVAGPGTRARSAGRWGAGSREPGSGPLTCSSGGMAERTNAQLLKSCEVQASVGSNPTPSAHERVQDLVPDKVARFVAPLQPRSVRRSARVVRFQLPLLDRHRAPGQGREFFLPLWATQCRRESLQITNSYRERRMAASPKGETALFLQSEYTHRRHDTFQSQSVVGT